MDLKNLFKLLFSPAFVSLLFSPPLPQPWSCSQSPSSYLTNILFVSPALRVSIDIYCLHLNHFSPWFLCWFLHFKSHWCHSPLLPLLCYSTFLFSFPFCLLCFSCLYWHTVSIARRSLAGPVDSSVLSRLLTPTQASLARSKSAAALSAEGGDTQGNTREKGRPSSYLCLD